MFFVLLGVLVFLALLLCYAFKFDMKIGVGVAVLISVIVSQLVKSGLDKLGGLFGRIFYPRGKYQPSTREMVLKSMAVAKYQRTAGQYDEAVRVVNEILELDPDFPDALMLKAEIMLEGFPNFRIPSDWIPLIPQDQFLLMIMMFGLFLLVLR